MKIYIKGSYKPLGDSRINVYDAKREAITYNGNYIELTTSGAEIIAIKELEITASDLKYFNDTLKLLPRDEALEQHLMEQYKDLRHILKYLQVFDAIFKLDSELRMQQAYEWSQDQVTWFPVPDKRVTKWIPKGLQNILPQNLMGQIARLAANNIPVFQAFTHLYKAYDDENSRYKWINGTIAAEHAFKEFLSLVDPRVESLMLNIPSPPIEKLYKTVLKAYTGHESSMFKELQKGAQRRNELIHKPATPSPDMKETNIYLHQVEVAIFELYIFLYPTDRFFAYSLKRATDRL